MIALSFVAIAALAAGLQGWMFARTNVFERILLIVGGSVLVLPLGNIGFGGVYLPVHADYVGIGLVALAALVQLARRARAPVVPA